LDLTNNLFDLIFEFSSDRDRESSRRLMPSSVEFFCDSIAVDELLSQNLLGSQRSSHSVAVFLEDEDKLRAIDILDDHEGIVCLFFIYSVSFEILVVIIRVDHISCLYHPVEHKLSESDEIKRFFADQMIDNQSFISAELHEMQSIT